MDETKGRYVTVYRPKPTAVPPDGVNKIAYYDDDWETVREFVPFTEEELKQVEIDNKNKEIPARVDSLEVVQEEVVLYMADMIGGAANAD